MIERRSTRPDSCGQDSPEVAVNADVTAAHGGPAVTIFTRGGLQKISIDYVTGSRLDTITHAQDCDTRSQSTDHVNHMKGSRGGSTFLFFFILSGLYYQGLLVQSWPTCLSGDADQNSPLTHT